MSLGPTPKIEPPDGVADFWEQWCGVTPWSIALRKFGALGGLIKYWCGVPRSASAIPLTFGLYRPDGTELPCSYRLKDILAAIDTLEKERAQ